jgi:hypothetical protein
MQNFDHNIGFREKRQFFAENCNCVVTVNLKVVRLAAEKKQKQLLDNPENKTIKQKQLVTLHIHCFFQNTKSYRPIPWRESISRPITPQATTRPGLKYAFIVFVCIHGIIHIYVCKRQFRK